MADDSALRMFIEGLTDLELVSLRHESIRLDDPDTLRLVDVEIKRRATSAPKE